MSPILRAPRTMRAARAAAAMAWAVSMLAGCGGGELIDPFRPTRQLSFGDETSALTAEGRNWGVNGVDATTGVVDCTINRNWVQYLAATFGLVFPQCNPSGQTPQAVMYAVPGAKVADVVAQIDAHLAADRVGPDQLVTILVGQNDILEQYARYPAADEATLTAVLRERGTQLAAQVNRIANLDGRVLVSTVPDLGLTPFAVTEAAAHADTDRAALLTRLTAAFNARMRANLINDGRLIGLVLADEMTQAIRRFPASFGYADVTQAACAVAPPDCTSQTLVAGASASWLWASTTQLGSAAQLRLGGLAEARARNNPF